MKEKGYGARVRLNGLVMKNSIYKGDRVNKLTKWWPPIIWPLPRTSYSQNLTWAVLKTGIYLLLWNHVKAPTPDALWWSSMSSENRLTLLSHATHHHLIILVSLIIPKPLSHVQWLRSGCSMKTPLSQQHHQVIKSLSHHDPSIIMQSSPQV